MKTKIIALILAAAMLFVFAACGAEDNENGPEEIITIISLSPSTTEIIAALGFGGRIIGADTQSAGISGLPSDIPMFDMFALDGEQVIALEPDIIFSTHWGEIQVEGPYEVIRASGIRVIDVMQSESIEAIKGDIRFIAETLGAEERGEELVAGMEREIERVRAACAGLEPRTVYFELDAAYGLYSLGQGTFINEMLELIGAVNIFGELDGWLSVSEEQVIDRDPDVILVSNNYLENPETHIASLPGFDAIAAVRNGEIYLIDADAASRPTHNIVTALVEMARAVHPELEI